MRKQDERTIAVIGEKALLKLKNARVAVFGIGGVGGYCIEALARAGVGTLVIFDHDTVSESNINRQIIALHSTVGRSKAEVMAERIADINPECDVEANELFYLPDTAGSIDLTGYDYIVDAIDTVTGKLTLITNAKAAGVPVISSMGTGNKIDPTRLEVADIEKTSICPLARIMRKELKKRGIKGLKVVYSKEEPTGIVLARGEGDSPRATPGSVSFVPSAAGIILASEVIKDIIAE